MKKDKNIHFIIKKHIEKVSKELDIEIELLSYDVRYFDKKNQNFDSEYLYFIGMYIKENMDFYKKKYPDIDFKNYKAALIIKTYCVWKKYIVKLCLK